MKSAYELAMERLGGAKEYTEEQKAKLSEIDKKYKAKRVEVSMAAEDKLRAVQEPEEQDKIREKLARDLRRLEETMESEKDRIRNEKQT